MIEYTYLSQGLFMLDFLKTFAPFIYDIIVPFFLAYFLVNYTKKFNEHSFDLLMLLQLRLFFPLGSFLAIWSLHLTYEMIWLPVSGILMHLIPYFLGYIRQRKYNFDYRSKGSYLITMLVSNSAMLGAMTSYFILGETSYAYTALILSPAPFMVNGIGFTMAARCQALAEGANTGAGSVKEAFRGLISLNQMALYATIIGLVLNLSHIPRPSFASDIISVNIHLSMWSAMIPIGASLCFAGVKKYRYITPDVAVIKFIILPVMLILISFIFIDDEMALKTIFLIAASPAPMVAVMLSKIYKLNVDLAMSPFIYTTVIYLAVMVPAFILIMRYIWV
jgi:predicted permease